MNLIRSCSKRNFVLFCASYFGIEGLIGPPPARAEGVAVTGRVAITQGVGEAKRSTNSSSANVQVRRFTTEGEKLPDVDLSSLGAFTMKARLANQIQGIVYLWDPFAWRIARVDLNAGRLDGVESIDRKLVTGSAAGGGILDGLARAIGNWIAPTTAAKVSMDPALAFSPDGARIYALATTASSFTDGGAPSAGVCSH